jgi:hypothetical protein
LSPAELRLTNLVTTDAVAEVLPRTDNPGLPVAQNAAKSADRFASQAVQADPEPQPAKSTKTAEAIAPTGGSVAPPQ